MDSSSFSFSHLDRLEAESIYILREVVAEFRNPVLLYSVGKDSSVLLHLLLKAFAPAPPPIPLLHVDTRWKFREMIAFRDRRVAETGVQLRVHINLEGVAQEINPITHGAAVHTDIMKTQGLRQALEQGQFDAAIGGARRDEEKSRAKERVFSFRNAHHRWDPKTNVLNCGMCTTRVFILERACGYFHCLIGLNWMCGCTSIVSRFRWCRYILLHRAQWLSATVC